MLEMQMKNAPVEDYADAWAEEISLLRLLRKYKVPGAGRVLKAIQESMYRRKRGIKMRTSSCRFGKLTTDLDTEIEKIETEVWKMIHGRNKSIRFPSFDKMDSLTTDIEKDSNISDSQREDLLKKVAESREKAFQ
eukprot:180272-Hanusia_phi.AAC.1